MKKLFEEKQWKEFRKAKVKSITGFAKNTEEQEVSLKKWNNKQKELWPLFCAYKKIPETSYQFFSAFAKAFMQCIINKNGPTVENIWKNIPEEIKMKMKR